jgi:D-3-phosphoglycerate dehydrogenase
LEITGRTAAIAWENRTVPNDMNYSLNKDKIKIVLLEGVHQSAVETLKNEGYQNIHFYTTALPEDELIEILADAHFVGIRSRTQITRKVLESAPNC